jgi:hypothetical protein
MKMKIFVLMLVATALLNGMLAPVVYFTPIWNLRHTEVIRGWDAVLEYCVIMGPIACFVLFAGVALLVKLIDWAVK